LPSFGNVPGAMKGDLAAQLRHVADRGDDRVGIRRSIRAESRR
jgi:hypothetical protein